MALAVPVRLCRCWTAENGKEPGRSGSEGLSFVPKVADGPRGRKPASLCRCLLPPGNVRRAPLAVHMQLAHNCSLRTSVIAWSFLSCVWKPATSLLLVGVWLHTVPIITTTGGLQSAENGAQMESLRWAPPKKCPVFTVSLRCLELACLLPGCKACLGPGNARF